MGQKGRQSASRVGIYIELDSTLMDFFLSFSSHPASSYHTNQTYFTQHFVYDESNSPNTYIHHGSLVRYLHPTHLAHRYTLHAF